MDTERTFQRSLTHFIFAMNVRNKYVLLQHLYATAYSQYLKDSGHAGEQYLGINL